MRFFFICLCFLGIFAADAQESSLRPEDFFDPDRDPVAVMVDGSLRFTVSELVILRSISANFKRVGAIEHLDKRFWNNNWFMVLESRHSQDMVESVYVMVRLRADEKGAYFAEPWWMACTGNSCSSCEYTDELDGCVCRYDKPGEPGVPGFCYHTVSDDPLLVKVLLKEP